MVVAVQDFTGVPGFLVGWLDSPRSTKSCCYGRGFFACAAARPRGPTLVEPFGGGLGGGGASPGAPPMVAADQLFPEIRVCAVDTPVGQRKL